MNKIKKLRMAAVDQLAESRDLTIEQTIVLFQKFCKSTDQEVKEYARLGDKKRKKLFREAANFHKLTLAVIEEIYPDVKDLNPGPPPLPCLD